ncbi:MAG: 2-oxoglutarate dehydrogenase E1 component [Thermoanaerobaculia bacterium]
MNAGTAQGESVSRVLESFRRWGYLGANLDPLGRLPPVGHPELDSANHESAAESAAARKVYCGTLAVEFMHIPEVERRNWIAARMEAPVPAPDRRRILEQLVRSEIFEETIQGRYIGSKRFSIEGVAALIPFLITAIDQSAELGAEQAMIAMSHRGRLNVMTQVVGRTAVEIFAGFEDVDPRSALGSGDVKYHLGATGTQTTPSGKTVRLHLNSNPSHLEAVNAVAMGRMRAKLTRFGDLSGKRVLPLLLHGDSAFAGQGIAAETLNFETLDGFAIGGSLQIVVNNLIGFTTEPRAYSSTRYATDIARRLPVPIFHVNAEDPEAVVRAARIAVDYRYAFASDVVIDLIGYRRYGHSEVDDPTVTQPLLYRKIKELPQIWKSYAAKIGVPAEDAQAAAEGYRQSLIRAHEEAKSLTKTPVLRALPSYWTGYQGGRWERSLEVDTALPAEDIARLGEALTKTPEGFHLHPKVEKLLEERRKMSVGEKLIDYGMAEALAFASLLESGVPVRLSGQDTRRGTFNHRHAALIDVENESVHVPLAQIARTAKGASGPANGGPAPAFFEVYDTMLSEAAAMGFEYGFSRDYPEALVLWEAQFGDFANGAQIIIDQFLAAGEDKWQLLSGLVLLLPHGFEGQGPEHSSARIERYLQLCGEDNLQVCQPSTASQYFHLLRRQAMRTWRKPLVVFTPKSMLRNAEAASPVAAFGQPRFETLLQDREVAAARRILLASGKILHELRVERKRRGATDVAILGLEQIHPFPEAELEIELTRYSGARELLWVQEEPANMGAYSFVDPILDRIARGRSVRSVKRSASASPATGSSKAHAMEQKTLIQLAFA